MWIFSLSNNNDVFILFLDSIEFVMHAMMHHILSNASYGVVRIFKSHYGMTLWKCYGVSHLYKDVFFYCFRITKLYINFTVFHLSESKTCSACHNNASTSKCGRLNQKNSKFTDYQSIFNCDIKRKFKRKICKKFVSKNIFSFYQFTSKIPRNAAKKKNLFGKKHISFKKNGGFQSSRSSRANTHSA